MKVDEAKAGDDVVVDRSYIGCDNCGIGSPQKDVSVQGMVLSIIGSVFKELMISLRSLLLYSKVCQVQHWLKHKVECT